jgi:hypothetical protein
LWAKRNNVWGLSSRIIRLPQAPLAESTRLFFSIGSANIILNPMRWASSSYSLRNFRHPTWKAEGNIFCARRKIGRKKKDTLLHLFMTILISESSFLKIGYFCRFLGQLLAYFRLLAYLWQFVY